MELIRSENEKVWLAQLKNGDHRAFEALYHHYKKPLTGKFLRLLKSDELAQDALQDLFTKIWEMREQINPEQAFGALLYKMAQNLVTDLYRRAGRDEQLREHLLLGAQIDYSHIEETLVSKENIAIVQQALQQLPPRQREVFVKHKLEGKSYKEISEELGISPSAINNHVYRATQTLIKLLNPGLLILLALLSASLIAT
ncbi:RNA polymerase sigma-70 factor, ECF subfamily [bacterium A37T11]|nr:RNA polymerase sigma-70 factor, ECF subfamily [bacterium A37T11]